MNKEVKILLDHCRNYAEDLLMETGELFPFGALTDQNGMTHHREYEIDKSNIPSNGEIMDILLGYFRKEFEEGRAKAFALAFEASVQLDENSRTDAIAVDIRHRDENDLPVYYFPFRIVEKDLPVIGEVFAVKKKH